MYTAPVVCTITIPVIKTDALAPCEWDGADSKRKALQSMTVSLSTLKPCSNHSLQKGCKAGSILGLGKLLETFSSSATESGRHGR